MLQDKNTKDIPKTEIWKYKIESIDTPFNSLETVKRYVYGAAKQDNFTAVWQDLGFDYPTKKDFKTPHKKDKKIRIYGTGYAFGSDNGNILDYLERFENYSFEGAYQYIAKLYNLEYELVNLNDSKTSKPQKATKPKQDTEKAKKAEKKALVSQTQTYFENRIYSELGLNENEAKDYFFTYFPSLNDTDFGIGIKYTNLEKETIKYGSECTEFDRIRLTNPIGKKKYHSQKDSGYFPYLTPLAYNQNLLSNKALYCIEGEFKAFFAVEKLQIPCIGIGGIHLGITIESKTDSKGYSYKDKNTSEFLPLTKEVIEKGKFESYTLIFDSDTFSNEGKKDRALSFSSAIERQIIAAQKVGIKEFTFTCINQRVAGLQIFDRYGREVYTNDNYDNDRPFSIVESGGGYSLVTSRKYGKIVGKINKNIVRRKLSNANLETLAIIAYRQPISRPGVESIRGVNSKEIINGLIDKGYVRIIGRSDAPGNPYLYGTTIDFLKSFGLNDLDDLPKLKELKELGFTEAEESQFTLKIEMDEEPKQLEEQNVSEDNEHEN